jgi:hypothetical protein
MLTLSNKKGGIENTIAAMSKKSSLQVTQLNGKSS